MRNNRPSSGGGGHQRGGDFADDRGRGLRGRLPLLAPKVRRRFVYVFMLLNVFLLRGRLALLAPKRVAVSFPSPFSWSFRFFNFKIQLRPVFFCGRPAL